LGSNQLNVSSYADWTDPDPLEGNVFYVLYVLKRE
jgi:hypothetical protein